MNLNSSPITDALSVRITEHATRSERVSWNRKMDNMVTLLASLKPIEDQIAELLAEKMPIYDGIQALRAEMVNTCVHPTEYLVQLTDTSAVCKFCNKTIHVHDFA